MADVDPDEILECHRKSGAAVTVTCAQPRGRFGAVEIAEDGRVMNFREKTRENEGWVNAGYMVLEPRVMNYIEGDDTVFEQYPLEECARRGELNAYRHRGFWQCMDTMREKEALEKLWDAGEAPWKVW